MPLVAAVGAARSSTGIACSLWPCGMPFRQPRDCPGLGAPLVGCAAQHNVAMLPGCGATCQNGFSVGAELWGRKPCSSSCSMLLEAWHKREAKTSVALSELYLALLTMFSVFSSSAGRVFTNIDWPA